MYSGNNTITIEQGDLCWFRDSNGNLRKGKYWYKESQSLVFYGEDGKMYKDSSFVKNIDKDC